jgi:hypothetical protein
MGTAAESIGTRDASVKSLISVDTILTDAPFPVTADD